MESAIFGKRWIRAGAAFVLSFGLAASAWAEDSTKKFGGTAVPAIVGEKQMGESALGANTTLDIPVERVLLVFLVLCGLIYLTYFGLKKYSSWSRGAAAKKRSCAVLDTVPLGGKRFVTVTRVYDRILVLGVGENGISLLTEIQEEEETGKTAPAPTAAAKTRGAEQFLNLISGLTRRQRAATSDKAAEAETALL